MAYEDFTVTSPQGGMHHCRFHNLMVGIAPRHSDTVDVRFLVNGKPVAVALAHQAFAEFKRRTGRALTDADSIEMAGLFLKERLERGAQIEDAILAVSVDRTLELAQQARSVIFS